MRPIRPHGRVFLSTTITLALTSKAHRAQDRTVLCNRICGHLKRNITMSFTKCQVSLKLTFLFQHFEKSIVLIRMESRMLKMFHKNGISSRAQGCPVYVPPKTLHFFWLLETLSVNQRQHTGEATDKKKNVCGAQKPHQFWNLVGIPQKLQNYPIANFQGAMEMGRKETILDNEFEGIWKIMRFKFTLLMEV